VASSRAGALNAFVDQPGEEAGVDDELPPFRIECRSRFGRDRLVTRPPLFFQRRDVVPDGNQHVAEFLELGLVADGLAVTWNDDGVVCRRRQIGVGRGDHSVDAAAGRIIDERINAVPESVTDVNDVGLGEGDGDVAVGMRRPIIFQGDRRAIEPQIVFGCKNFARNSTRWQCKEVIIPIFDALNLRKMLACVRLRDDFRAGRMQPVVAAGVIEMPVRVDEMGDGIGAEVGEGLGDLRTRSRDTGIDEEFAIGARQDGNVAAGALENADIVSQLVGLDRRYRGAVLDQAD